MAFYQGYQYQQPYVYPQNYAQMQQPVQQTQSNPQIQNGGFVSVRSEADARNYPVAPGNSVTFKDENAPYIYTKTMGFSQLDRPTFEKYKLVKEMPSEAPNLPQNEAIDTRKVFSTVDEIKAEIKAIWSEIDAIKEIGSFKSREKGGDD